MYHFIKISFLHILEAVEESRKTRSMARSLNSTFVVLIPKVRKPTSFGDYRPIALCNLAYKIIAKLIANRIKPILSKFLSGETTGVPKG
jgi:hypothetical protein